MDKDPTPLDCPCGEPGKNLQILGDDFDADGSCPAYNRTTPNCPGTKAVIPTWNRLVQNHLAGKEVFLPPKDPVVDIIEKAHDILQEADPNGPAGNTIKELSCALWETAQTYHNERPTKHPGPLAEPKVVCAALRNDEGEIICSPRHFDTLCHQQIKARGGSEIWINSEQGFVDQFGNFLTREEARKIAALRGQIRRRCGGDAKKLFSENLY